MKANKPIFNYVDCIRIYIPDLEKGLEYYHHKLGLQIAWKTDNAVGLLMKDGKTEIVIQNEDKGQETDIMVDSVEDTIKIITKAGGKVIYGPINIKIGKCAVIEDPWNNKMVILDSAKGTFITEKNGNIIGQECKEDV
jgi:predicted enzyme related to lactoylglutathione lyase